MTHMRLKLTVAGVVFVTAIGYLVFAGASKGWTYTVGVDTYLNDPVYRAQRVRLCGQVAPEGVVTNAVALRATFHLQGKDRSIPVAYHGVIPDLFKPGCEVIVEGKMDGAGTFQADVMMTKCASKYEEHKEAKEAQAAGKRG